MSARTRRARGRRTARRRLLLVALVAMVVVAAAVVMIGRGGDDPFVGVYWDKTTARRIEIRVKDDGYAMLYGTARLPHPAVREGDELIVREPFGGETLVRLAEGKLVLVSGGRTRPLTPLSDGR